MEATISNPVAEVIAGLFGLYILLGLLFALFFHVGPGKVRIDRAATGSSWGFRVLITPGLIGLWPVLLRRALTGDGETPVEASAHRDAAREPSE